MPKFTLHEVKSYMGGCYLTPAPSNFDKSNPLHKEALADALQERGLLLVAYVGKNLIVKKVD